MVLRHLRCLVTIIAGFVVLVLVFATDAPGQVLGLPNGTPNPANSPSSTPFVANPALAEPAPPNAAATPTPDLTYPSQPFASPAPQPSAAAPSAVQTGGPPKALPVAPQEIITRLQIFLDQRHFGPGKIDGRWGEFTAKALIRYQVALGQKPTGQIDVAMQQELEKIFPIYTTYTLAAEDLRQVNHELPYKPSEEAHAKALVYRSLAEFLGERFHSDEEFIAKLNRGVNLEKLKPGDLVRVPNVQPFEIETLKEVASVPLKPQLAGRILKVDTRYRMLDVIDSNRLVCSFPITPGSKRLPAPIGTWKIVGIATLPWFRWDEAMLEHGQRSDDYYNLPPGPRNPVGVVWIGLSKRGIGIHGTNSPGTIGRSGSHGCIRLANWDAARIINEVTGGMTVQIF